MLPKIKPKQKQRTQLFFGKWQYCFRIKMDRPYMLRDCLTKNTLTIEQKHHLINSRVNTYSRSAKPLYTRSSNFAQKLTVLLEPSLEQFFCVIDWSRLNIYCNDLSLVADIENLMLNLEFSKHDMQLISCKLVGTPGAIILRESKFKYRTYLRTAGSKASVSVCKWLQNQGDTIGLAPSLQQRLQDPDAGLLRHHYFDHNDPKILSFLDLVQPKSYRKTYKIETTTWSPSFGK